ncbi:hypothetical protein ACOI22_03310 [Glaciecola sp. 2405UD65-10]|uniref:hypothetical protein n=1 Tax=Glaciecola sp. 2405UD65-10 TaxID=3397244 RepID=UPI003B5CA0AB
MKITQDINEKKAWLCRVGPQTTLEEIQPKSCVKVRFIEEVNHRKTRVIGSYIVNASTKSIDAFNAKDFETAVAMNDYIEKLDGYTINKNDIDLRATCLLEEIDNHEVLVEMLHSKVGFNDDIWLEIATKGQTLGFMGYSYTRKYGSQKIIHRTV